jgi:S-adenosylhomocysteine hydrolase
MRRMCSKILILTLFAVALCGCNSLSTSKETVHPTATAGLPTVSVTPTTEQQLSALLQQALAKDASLTTVTYDSGGQAVNVVATLTIKQLPTVNVGQEMVKILCFRIQKALWLSGIPLKQVSVAIEGPTYGVYGDLTSGGYGGVLVRQPTAAKLDWSTVSPDTAWLGYNSTWLTYNYSNDS